MSKLLLVVHGMGSYAAGWSTAIRDKLDEMASSYAAFRRAPKFSERVTFAEIRYDDVFQELIDQWQAQSEALAAFGTAQGMPLPKVVRWLESTLPQDDAAAKAFFWSTAIDPLLYRGFKLVRDRVRAVVTSRVANALITAMRSGSVDASVLAHSLGTAVTHDSLQKLGSAPFEGNESLTAKRYQFTNLFMLADVCVLGPAAVRDIDYFHSVVRPAKDGDADDTYCQFFVNVWHRWDPFVLCGPFRPTTWGDGYFPVGPLEHFHQANVHGFTHYLDHPAVHIPIINGTLGDRVIPSREEQDALARYPQIGSPECAAQIQTLQDTAKEFANVGDDLEGLVIKGAEFYAAAKRAAETCRGLAGDLLA